MAVKQGTPAADARVETVKRVSRANVSRTETDLGKAWSRRLKASEAYFKANSKDWKALERLYEDMYALRAKHGAAVAIGWAVVNNLVVDSYTRNPEPEITSLDQLARPELDRQLRDLFRAIHADTDLAGVMKRSMTLSHVHGYAGVWSYHEQFDRYDPVPMDPNVPDAEPQTLATAVKQRFCHEDVPAIDLRHDPYGSRWDLSDHQWVARIYTKPLQWFIDEFMSKGERSGFTADGVRRLTGWASGRRNKRRPSDSRWTYADQSQYTEDDPAYMPVSVFEIWTRADFQVIHVPVDADFEIGQYPWPEEWRNANFGRGEFPLTIVAFNKALPTETSPGFYPIPTLRQIRQPLENINKITARYLESTSISIKKYIALKGLLTDKERSQFQSETAREIIEVDISKLRKVFPDLASSFGAFDISKILTQIEQEDSSDAQRWLGAIANELAMIAEVIGQGSAARGGVSPAESATATLTIAEKLQARTSEVGEQAAMIVDRIDAKTYLMFPRQTLPIPYRMATARGDQVWSQFPAETLDGVQLVFSHRNGSTRTKNKEQMKADLQQLATITLPVLSDLGMKREVKTVMRAWMQTLDLDVADGLFEDEIPQLVQQVMDILNRVSRPDGGLDTTDENLGIAFVQAVGQLCSALASPADVQQVADGQLSNMSAAPAENAKSRGSLPGHGSGQSAYGAAAAGRIGGMSGGVQ